MVKHWLTRLGMARLGNFDGENLIRVLNALMLASIKTSHSEGAGSLAEIKSTSSGHLLSYQWIWFIHREGRLDIASIGVLEVHGCGCCHKICQVELFRAPCHLNTCVPHFYGLNRVNFLNHHMILPFPNSLLNYFPKNKPITNKFMRHLNIVVHIILYFPP